MIISTNCGLSATSKKLVGRRLVPALFQGEHYGTEKRPGHGGPGGKRMRRLLPHLPQDPPCGSRSSHSPLLRQGDGRNVISDQTGGFSRLFYILGVLCIECPLF